MWYFHSIECARSVCVCTTSCQLELRYTNSRIYRAREFYAANMIINSCWSVSLSVHSITFTPGILVYVSVMCVNLYSEITKHRFFEFYLVNTKQNKFSGARIRRKGEERLRIITASKYFMKSFIHDKSNSQCSNIVRNKDQIMIIKWT